MREIGPETLDQRVTIARPPEELESAVTALNGLLARVEEGFERERRFSSDVAHELRTPLAEVLAACEVGAKWPDDPQATRQLFEDLQGSAWHLRKIVNSLLELSRCDNGTATVTKSRVPLGPLVEECWQGCTERARAKNMSFERPADDQTVVESDHHRLRMIVQNLLDNAVTLGGPGSTISCEISPGSVPMVRVSNAASSFANDEVSHIFDRFWQRGVSRTASEHSGLGLSIVKALCDLLGIRVRAEVEDEERFVMTLSFPPS